MAITNHDRVGKSLELLKAGLGPFAGRQFESAFKERAAIQAAAYLGEDRLNARRPVAEWDVAALLKLMCEAWNDVFRRVLGPAERNLLSELRDHRNKWAHQEPFSSDDAYRALDSACRLLVAVSAPQAGRRHDRERGERQAEAALRRLAASATFLYQDGARYWYSTQPTVTKLADDRAEQFKRDTGKIVQEVDRRLRADVRRAGDFERVQLMQPSTTDALDSSEVPDELDTRLVVFSIDHVHSGAHDP